MQKSAKFHSSQKSAKQGRLTSSHRGGALRLSLVILLCLASQIKIFGEALPKSKAKRAKNMVIYDLD
jgi:hypothetical protein